MLITLDDKLTVNEKYLELTKKANSKASLCFSRKPVREDNLHGDLHHLNYLRYLEICWGTHLGVVLTPDIFWYTILSEVATAIKADPERYRDLFTKNKEKTNILVSDITYPVLNLEEVIEKLYELVPYGLAKDLLGDFSCSEYRDRQARYTVFCDAVSPFYNYCMYCCGIPKIEVKGTSKDWDSILDRLNILYTNNLIEKDYYFDTLDIVNGIKEVDVVFWKDMFYLKRCGSGSQNEVFGWFSKLFFKQPSVRFAENFSSHVSSVSYRNLPTDENFVMKQGLFSSRIQDGLLVPEFGRIVYNEK